VSLANYPSIKLSQEISVTVLNPCWNSILIPPVISNFYATVKQPWYSYAFSAFSDTVSSLYGTGYDICGQREYSVSFTTVNGGTLNTGNCFIISSTAPTLSAGTNSQF
jgi:hypothetical protein